MSVNVLIGYKDSESEYHGFQGFLEITEYKLLKRLAEKCAHSDILSIDELVDLSDVKDLLARAQIRLYEFEKGFSEAKKQKLESITNALGAILGSFDVYRKDAPQLDFLLSFCWIDASGSDSEDDYASGKFWAVNEDEEEYFEDIGVEKPTKGKKARRDEWINYLASVKAIPVWDESFQPFQVDFRRLTTPENGGVHLEGFGKKTRRRVAEILGIEAKEDCERVQGEIEESFPVSSFDESIAVGDIKHIAVSEDLVFVIVDWIELDGRRLICDASTSELEIELGGGVEESDFEWWRDKMTFSDASAETNLTRILFKALRNNMLKCVRTGKLVLSSNDWSKRMELL